MLSFWLKVFTSTSKLPTKIKMLPYFLVGLVSVVFRPAQQWGAWTLTRPGTGWHSYKMSPTTLWSCSCMLSSSRYMLFFLITTSSLLQYAELRGQLPTGFRKRDREIFVEWTPVLTWSMFSSQSFFLTNLWLTEQWLQVVQMDSIKGVFIEWYFLCCWTCNMYIKCCLFIFSQHLANVMPPNPVLWTL